MGWEKNDGIRVLTRENCAQKYRITQRLLFIYTVVIETSSLTDFSRCLPRVSLSTLSPNTTTGLSLRSSYQPLPLEHRLCFPPLKRWRSPDRHPHLSETAQSDAIVFPTLSLNTWPHPYTLSALIYTVYSQHSLFFLYLDIIQWFFNSNFHHFQLNIWKK